MRSKIIMRIVIATDSFKGSLRSITAVRTIERGLHKVLPEVVCDCVALGDGGEGTLDALLVAHAGITHTVSVIGPQGNQLNARLGLFDSESLAMVEMAEASGLDKHPTGQLDPWTASSYGTGELIRAALAYPISQLVVGIGGSATNDGGAGLCQALGVRFYDAAGKLLTEPMAPNRLHLIHDIDIENIVPRVHEVMFEVMCDVDSPLLGKNGASAVFGPQKGADPSMVAQLDATLEVFYALVERKLGTAVKDRPGAGAAGGVGAALMAFFGASVRPGIEVMIEACQLRERTIGADLLITGEGHIDRQTLRGKAPAGVAALARQLDVPVVAIGGGLARDIALEMTTTFDALEASIALAQNVEQAMAHAEQDLEAAAVRVALWLKLGARMATSSASGRLT